MLVRGSHATRIMPSRIHRFRRAGLLSFRLEKQTKKTFVMTFTCAKRIIPAVALLAAALTACKKTGQTATPVVVQPKPNVVIAQNSKFGKVITDSTGRTLYFFSPDTKGQSVCNGGCAVAWPPFYQPDLFPGTGLDTSEFHTITRADGSLQTTFKGWPLYYFKFDANAGDVAGDGSEGVWFVSKPDYTVMLATVQLVGNDGISYDSLFKAGTGDTRILTDDWGKTLYAFSFDKADTNHYTKPDFSNDAFWPIYEVSAPLVAPSTIDPAFLGIITVFGKSQLTFKQWPVYHFGPDDGVRGSTKGVSVPNPGIWPTMNELSATAPE